MSQTVSLRLGADVGTLSVFGQVCRVTVAILPWWGWEMSSGPRLTTLNAADVPRCQKTLGPFFRPPRP